MESPQAEGIVKNSPDAVNGGDKGTVDGGPAADGGGERDTGRPSRGWQGARGVLLATKAAGR